MEGVVEYFVVQSDGAEHGAKARSLRPILTILAVGFHPRSAQCIFAEVLFGQGEAAHEGSVAGIGTQGIEGGIANAENQLIILNGERLL